MPSSCDAGKNQTSVFSVKPYGTLLISNCKIMSVKTETKAEQASIGRPVRHCAILCGDGMATKRHEEAQRAGCSKFSLQRPFSLFKVRRSKFSVQRSSPFLLRALWPLA